MITNKKAVVIINGQGGAGKDTFIGIAQQFYNCVNKSSVDCIKEIAKVGGWQGEKTPKARKMLADLKEVFTAYNDLPFNNMVAELELFLDDPESQVLFMHIREPKNIERMAKFVSDYCPCGALAVVTGSEEKLGNEADDEWYKYEYNAYFSNKKDKPMNPENVFSCMELLLVGIGMSQG